VPAAAAAATSTNGADGSLVVQNGTATGGVPVVQLQITGSVIGHVDYGRVVIDAGPASTAAPEVTGYEWRKDGRDTAQVWGGTNFKFRAVNGKFTVLIYGSGVDIVAIGKGWARLTGSADTPKLDGRYSLNGGDWVSLPGDQSDKLNFPSAG
jgi:hypothetical protein